MIKKLFSILLFFFLFSGTAFADVLYSQNMQTLTSTQITFGTDHIEQSISCEDVYGIIEEVDVYFRGVTGVNTDFNLQTKKNGVLVARSSHLTTDTSFGVRTYDMGDIFNGASNYGNCNDGTGEVTFRLKVESNNGNSMYVRGHTDIYSFSDCAGTDCGTISDLYLVLRGTPAPFIPVGDGIYFFGKTAPSDNPIGDTSSQLGQSVRTNLDNGVIQTTLLALGVFLSFYILQKIIMFFGYVYNRRERTRIEKFDNKKADELESFFKEGGKALNRKK